MMPTSSFSQSRIATMKNVLAEWSQGGERPGLYCPGAPPPAPIPHARLGVGFICGLWVLPGQFNSQSKREHTRANVLTQIVPNSSSLYTLIYSVIYNSVNVPFFSEAFKYTCRTNIFIILLPLKEFSSVSRELYSITPCHCSSSKQRTLCTL